MKNPLSRRRAMALAMTLFFCAHFALSAWAQTPPGYRLARLANGQLAGDLYEGGAAFVILERLTDSDIAATVPVTTQTVTEEESIFLAGSPAIPGEDFTPATTQINFAPGQTTAVVPVAILNDSLREDRLEFIKIRHPRGPTQPELIDEFAAIADNEFNPLPARPLCLGGLPISRVSRLLPLADGKIMAMVLPAIPGGNVELLRFTPNGEPDPAFTPASLARAGVEMHELPGGKLLVLEVPIENIYRARRLNPNGSTDDTFLTYSMSGYVPALIPAPNGKVYVTEPRTVTRLNENGTVDITFTRPALSDNITSGIAAPDGSLYITGQFETVNGAARPHIAHFTTTGALDAAFAPTGRAFPIFFWNGAPHIAQDATLYRLTPTGARDPNFTPIPLPNNDRAIHVDTEGRFYRLHYSQSWIIQRFTPQGIPDSTSFRGTIQTRFDSPAVWLAQGAAYVMGQISVINATPMRCGADPSAYTAGLAKVEFDQPPGTIQIEPAETRLLEGTPDPAALHIIRTGDNALPTSPIRYRLRNGTAIAGRDFQADPTGQFSFPAAGSRVSIPIQIFDDTQVEPESFFYIDFLRDDDSVFATGEFSILSDDIGVKIVRRISADEWEILPLVGDSEWAELRSTADFQSWTSAIVPANQPLRIRTSDPRKFYTCVPRNDL